MNDRKLAIAIGKVAKQLETYGYELKRCDELCGITFSKKSENDEWAIHIENHTDDSEYHDWLIYIYRNSEDNIDWYGQKYEAGGCISFEVMKLVVELVNLLKGEK